MALVGFDQIRGQSEAIELLRRLCVSDRLPHALLFAGPAGVGKATAAGALGGWFLCTQPKGDRACGKCESCRVFPSGNHPDYHVVTKEMARIYDKTGKSKASQLTADVIRGEVVHKAEHTSVMNRGKFFVVEEAELMNPHAQNVMLKTLEEPGGRTAIVLLAESSQFLLATILSRCQVVRFGRLEEKLIVEELGKRGIDGATAKEAAGLSDGSLGGALRLISEGTLAPARQLCEQVDGMLGGKPPADLAGFLTRAAAGYADKQLERDPLSSKETATRTGLSLFLHVASERLRVRLHEAGSGSGCARRSTRRGSARCIWTRT